MSVKTPGSKGAAPAGGINPIDEHVGDRIRVRRRELGLAQQQLAAQLGLTFQQVQKYERGTNRVSASKLYEIARALKTPLAYFFEGLADTASDGPMEFEAFRDLGATAEGRELAALFPRLKAGRVRRRVLDLVRALADEHLHAEIVRAD